MRASCAASRESGVRRSRGVNAAGGLRLRNVAARLAHCSANACVALSLLSPVVSTFSRCVDEKQAHELCVCVCVVPAQALRAVSVSQVRHQKSTGQEAVLNHPPSRTLCQGWGTGVFGWGLGGRRWFQVGAWGRGRWEGHLTDLSSVAPPLGVLPRRDPTQRDRPPPLYADLAPGSHPLMPPGPTPDAPGSHP